VEVSDAPALPDCGEALIEKSPTWTMPGVDEDMVHVDVAVPLAASVALVQVTVRPLRVPATLTVPAKF